MNYQAISQRLVGWTALERTYLVASARISLGVKIDSPNGNSYGWFQASDR